MAVEAPNNGRRVKTDDPLAVRMRARAAEFKAAGKPYPMLKVEDCYDVPFVWIGRGMYHEKTLDRIKPRSATQRRMVNLPDEWVIDGTTQLPGETISEYRHFIAFRDLGPNRSVKNLKERLGLKIRLHDDSLTALANRFRWNERCVAYDAQMQVEQRKVAQQLFQEQMKEELIQRDQYLESEWELVTKGIERVQEMLKMPPVDKESTTVSKDGKTIINVWRAPKWTYASIAQMIGELTKIGRLHTGLSTSNTASKVERPEEGGGRNALDEVRPEDQAMHAYASQKAEEAYFAACEEWKVNNAVPRLQATVMAADEEMPCCATT